MLVLTRKQSETIQIGDSITVTVLRMKGKAVRIGIQAPHEYNVIRGELAFELANATAGDDISAEEQDLPTLKHKSRIRENRNDSWSTEAKTTLESAVGTAAGAWSI
jgi:carbon storage regulator